MAGGEPWLAVCWKKKEENTFGKDALLNSAHLDDKVGGHLQSTKTPSSLLGDLSPLLSLGSEECRARPLV